jgi:hypothetical protein
MARACVVNYTEATLSPYPSTAQWVRHGQSDFAESGRDPSRVRQEGKLELTDASRSAKTVAKGIPEGFRLANSERVTAKAQERLAMPSPSPYHLQLLLVFLQRLQHRQKNQLPVVIAQYRFRAAFRMRHHAEHITLGIDDPGNVIQ